MKNKTFAKTNIIKAYCHRHIAARDIKSLFETVVRSNQQKRSGCKLKLTILQVNQPVVARKERVHLKRYTRVRFPVGSNQRLQKLIFTAFLLDGQQLNGQFEASTVCGTQVGRWQHDSKTERSLCCHLAKATW